MVAPLAPHSKPPHGNAISIRVRNSATVLLVFLAAICVATALLPLLPVDQWWIRIGDYPRVQLAIGYAVVGGLAIPLLRTTLGKGIVAAMLACIAFQLWWIFPYLPVAEPEVLAVTNNKHDAQIRILAANVLQSNGQARPLIELVDREQPDILVLCEIDDDWAERLQTFRSDFRFAKVKPQENGYGMAFYSNFDVPFATIRHFVHDDIPSIEAVFSLPAGQHVRLFAIHPNPPRPGEDTTKRDAELVLVGRAVDEAEPTIVLGDLNDVGWSRTTNLFQEISGLLDPRKARGIFPTFDASSSIWRYPLDYLFHSPDFRVAELRTLPDIGSDHFPLLVTLQYDPAAARRQRPPSMSGDDRSDAQAAVQDAKAKVPRSEQADQLDASQ